MQRWTEWIEQTSQIPPEEENTEIIHITEGTWRSMEQQYSQTNHQIAQSAITPGTIQIDQDLQQIRHNSILYQTLIRNPEIYEWITRPYAIQETKQAILTLKNNKSHGIDGIPWGRHTKLSMTG